VTGVTVRPALLSQEITEIPPATRVLEAVEQVKSQVDLGKGRVLTASQLLERFGFAGDRQWTPVGDLSGGERRRLQLLRLLMAEPNVLLLDEPTNDLDIDTLTALEDLLDGWPGSLVVVSHDRYFLERTTDRIAALLGDRRLRMLPGGVDQYLQQRAETLAAAGQSVASQPQRKGQGQGQGQGQGLAKGQGQAAAAPSRASSDRAAQKEMARIERQLDKIASREAELHTKMAEAATDYEAVGRLDTELRDLAGERERLEEQWLALAE
jgi:ATP-binding cassette subfamily F protein uup